MQANENMFEVMKCYQNGLVSFISEKDHILIEKEGTQV